MTIVDPSPAMLERAQEPAGAEDDVLAHRPDGHRKAPPTIPRIVLAVELEVSLRDPYRRLSRLFHLIGRRRSAGG